MKYEAFLFDWDGCLANTLPQWLIALSETMTDLKLPHTELNLITSMQDWSGLKDLGVMDENEFANRLYANFKHHLNDIELNEGAIETLIQLKEKRIKTAIVTSSPLFKLQPVMDRLAITQYFDAFITKDSVKQLKPHPEPIHLALQKLGCESDKTLIIGDSSVDIEAGQQAEISTVWYHPEHNKKFHSLESIAGLTPNHQIEHLSQLKQLV